MSGPSATPDASPETSQNLQGFLSNDEWDALLAHVDHLVHEMEHLPDAHLKKRVMELMQGIDALHREALHRLVRLFKEGVLEKVVTDPAIRTLMELYDLLPPNESEAIEGPATHKRPFPIPVRVEKVLPRRNAPLPHWVPAIEASEAPPAGASVVRLLDERDVLLTRVGVDWFALDARCAIDGASLDGAQLSRFTLVCPRHAGCLYDVRSGSRIGGGGNIRGLPVKTDEKGRVYVGFGMPFTPQLPSF